MYDHEEVNLRSYKGFNLVRTDPFGFWEIQTFDNKKIPELNQSFTMTRYAIQAIDSYLANHSAPAQVEEKKSRKVR